MYHYRVYCILLQLTALLQDTDFDHKRKNDHKGNSGPYPDGEARCMKIMARRRIQEMLSMVTTLAKTKEIPKPKLQKRRGREERGVIRRLQPYA